MGLGTGQRNISAALLVATTNFTDPEVMLMVLVGSVVGMAILFVAAGFFGKRSRRARSRLHPDPIVSSTHRQIRENPHMAITK